MINNNNKRSPTYHCDDGRGVIQQLHRVALKRFLVGGGENLSQSCRYNGTSGKHCVIDARIVNYPKSATNKRSYQRHILYLLSPVKLTSKS